MKHLDILKSAFVTLLLAVLLAAGAPGLRAQASFVLSKNADFSTDDRVFDRSDTIYMLVTAPQIDFADLEKNEFRLKPDDGGNDIRGAFTNHGDGTYTASVPLSITDPNEDDWEWRTKIEDDDDHKFEVRIDLKIGEDDGEDEDEDEDEDEGDDEVEFTGTIEALGPASITVDGITFVVDTQTIVLDDDNNAIAFDELALGMIVQIRGDRGADGVLVATHIKIEDEDDSPAVTGRLAAVAEDRLLVDTRPFLVDDGTDVLDADDMPMPLSGLMVGQTVVVHARNATAALPTANLIKVMGDGAVAAAAESAESGVPSRFLLEQNYPNPFNPKTTIAFEIRQHAAAEPVSLVIYNLLGETVQTLIQGHLAGGRYEYEWDARSRHSQPLATGLYLYRLRVGEQVQTRTMVLLK